MAVGRTVLGSHTKPQFDRAQGRERRQLVQEEIRAEVEARCVDELGPCIYPEDQLDRTVEVRTS